MNLLEANTEVLRKRDHRVFDRIFSDAAPAGELEVIETPAGFPSALYRGQYLHSRRDPVREAEKFVKNRDNPKPAILVMEGFGLGYHAKAFLSAFPELTIWVIEPDILLFRAILEKVDLRDILGDPRVLFFFNPEPVELASLAGEVNHNSFGIVKIRSVYEKNITYYESIDEELRRVIAGKTVNENTLKRFGKLWVRNLIRNLPLLPEAAGLHHLENKFVDFPCLVVAAGPSLENILPLMKEIRERFLIICVDTAFGPLMEAGVIPDFVTVVDPQYWNTRHLDGVDPGKTILISDTSTHPRIFRRPPGALCFCGSHFPLGTYLEEDTDISGTISPGGSVASTAWEAARFMGSKEICCAGLDLGFPGGLTHHRESFFEKRALYSCDRQKPLETHSYGALYSAGPYEVPDNSGDNVLTDQRMEVYIRWFESIIERYPDIKTSNLSAGGTAIKGMEAIKAEKLFERETIRHRLDPFLEEIKSSIDISVNNCINGKIDGYLKKIKKILNEFSEVADFSNRGLELCDLLEDKIKNHLPPEGIISMLDRLDEEILASSVKNMAGFLFQDVISGISTGSELSNPVENSRKLYSEILKSARYHMDLLTESIEKLEIRSG